MAILDTLNEYHFQLVPDVQNIKVIFFVAFAISVMFERLAKNGREFEEKTKQHINEYADAGLRTLILAYRELDEDEYNLFNKEFMEAKNLVSADREQIVEEVSEKIEKDLILLGATAVEDKLQNGVCYKYCFLSETR